MTDSNVASLPMPERKTRTHITVPVDALAIQLAQAEDSGVRAGSHDLPSLVRLKLLVERAATFETRVKLYIAMLQAEYL